MHSRTASAALIVISSDDDSDHSTPQVKLTPGLPETGTDSKPATGASKQPTQVDSKATEVKKPLKPKFMTATGGIPHPPNFKPKLVLTRVVSISSSEDEGSEPRSSADHLLSSPVKESHQNDVIDLTLTSSEEEDFSDSDTSDERDVVVLLEDTPPPPSTSRLKRLIKGSRFPEAVPEILKSNDSLPDSGNKAGPSATTLFSAPDLAGSRGGSSNTPVAYSSEPSGNSPKLKDLPPRPREKLPKPKPRQPSQNPDSNVDRPSSFQAPPSKSPTKKGKTPRVSKKALHAAEQARREAYAQKLFDDLNQSVFKGGLPEGTKLTWSKRLLTTAGRARWRRSRDGTQTTEIELATKVLDCDERIRNTLSHEMCHLACWIINDDPKEGHGRIFKAWAAKVSKKRPDIIVSTRHNYEINYPYEWECDNCAKVYGRYSKSIRPDECRCGTCKVGKLMPLFTTRTVRSSAKTTVVSQMAATQSDPSRAVYNVTESLLDLTLDESPAAAAGPSRPERPSPASGPLQGLEAQLESLTRELGGIDLLNVD